MKSFVNFLLRTYSIKDLIVFLSCITLLSLQSCEEKKTTEEILIGKWSIVSERIIGFQNEIKTEDQTYNYDPQEGAIQFFKDGTGKVYRNGAVVDTYKWYETNFDDLGYRYHYLWSEDTFSWEIVEGILTIILKDSSGGNAPLSVSFNVNASYLTLKFTSYDGEHWYESDIDGGHYTYHYNIREETLLTLSR